MSIHKKIQIRKIRRAHRVKNRLKNTTARPRLTVFRSLNHIYAQLIDDAAQVTLASFSSQHLKNAKGSKKEIAKKVGLELGKLVQSKAIVDICFDRGAYKYHGRIAALADGLRESGLNF